jgi:hypothetical protein
MRPINIEEYGVAFDLSEKGAHLKCADCQEIVALLGIVEVW